MPLLLNVLNPLIAGPLKVDCRPVDGLLLNCILGVKKEAIKPAGGNNQPSPSRLGRAVESAQI